MTARARRTDPPSSHGAIRDLFDTGRQGEQHVAARHLVEQNPGKSYLRLHEIHVQESERPGGRLIFKNPPALMRRLGEVAVKGTPAYCSIADRKISSWWPK
jgi:hypothetical protein